MHLTLVLRFIANLTAGDRVVAIREPVGGHLELISALVTQRYRLPNSMPFADVAWCRLGPRGRRHGNSYLPSGRRFSLVVGRRWDGTEITV